MKQTAVEWLMDRLPHSIETQFSKQIEQAKAMEKEQIVNAVDGFPLENRHLDGEQYYNETFKKK
jgi:hypothetical protein